MRALTCDEIDLVSGGKMRRRPSAFLKSTPSFSGRGDGDGVFGSRRGMNGIEGAALLWSFTSVMAGIGVAVSAPVSVPVLAASAAVGLGIAGVQTFSDVTR